MSKGKSERNGSGSREWFSPAENGSSSRQSEDSGRSEAWLGSGRVRPSSWDDSDEELSLEPTNSHGFRIHSGDCEKRQESVYEEINELKKQFFQSLAKEEETSSGKLEGADRRKSPARIRRRMKSPSSASPVFDNRPGTPEEVDAKNSSAEGNDPQTPEFELDAKFFISNLYVDLRSKKMGLEFLEMGRQLEEPTTGSPNISSENSRRSDEEDQPPFSQTSRKLSQILEVEEVRKEVEDSSEREEEEEKAEGVVVLKSGSPLREAKARSAPAGEKLRPEHDTFQEPLGLENFGKLEAEVDPFRRSVRDGVNFLSAKCRKTEIGLTKETGWLDEKSFQLPASTRDLNEILRIDLSNKTSRKSAENSSRTKSPKFKLNLESLRSEQPKDGATVEEDTSGKSTRADSIGQLTLEKSYGGCRRSSQSEDEKCTWKSAKNEEERDDGTSTSERSLRRSESRKGQTEKVVRNSSFRICSGDREKKCKETRDESSCSSSGSNSSDEGNRRSGQSEEAHPNWSKKVDRNSELSPTSSERRADSRITLPDDVGRCTEVKSAEITREHSENSSKSSRHHIYQKTTPTLPRARGSGSSSSSSSNSSTNVELTESFRHLKEQIKKTMRTPSGRSNRRSGRTSKGSKEQSPEISKLQESDGSSNRKTGYAAEEPVSGERGSSRKAEDSVSPGRSAQKSPRGNLENVVPENVCREKKTESGRASVITDSSYEKMEPRGIGENSPAKSTRGCSSTREAREERGFANEATDRLSDARDSGGGMWKDLIETFHGKQESPLGPQGSFPGFPSQREDSPGREKEEEPRDDSPPTSRKVAEGEREYSVQTRGGKSSSGGRSRENKNEECGEKNRILDAEVPLTEILQGTEAAVRPNPQSLYYFDVERSGMLGIGEFGDVAPWNAGDVKTVQPEAPKAHGDGSSAWEGLPQKRERRKKGKEFRVLRQLWTESKDDLTAGDGASSESRSFSASLKLSKSGSCVSTKEYVKPEDARVFRPNSDSLKKRKGEREVEVRSVSKTADEESSGSSEESESEEAEEFSSDARDKKWQPRQSFVNSKAFFEKTTKRRVKDSTDLKIFVAQRAEEKAAAKKGNNWLLVRDSGRRKRGQKKWKVPSRESSRGSGEFLFGRGLRSSVTPLELRNFSCLRNFYRRLVGVFCLTSDSSVGSSK